MNNIDIHVIKLLDDIHTSAKRILLVIEKETLESFQSPASLNVQDIVARRLTIIGEASAALLKKHPQFCEEHPEIPLRQARGMRNFLVHDYDGIRWDVVWNAVNDSIPELIKIIEPFLPNNS